MVRAWIYSATASGAQMLAHSTSLRISPPLLLHVSWIGNPLKHYWRQLDRNWKSWDSAIVSSTRRITGMASFLPFPPYATPCSIWAFRFPLPVTRTRTLWPRKSSRMVFPWSLVRARNWRPCRLPKHSKVSPDIQVFSPLIYTLISRSCHTVADLRIFQQAYVGYYRFTTIL